MSDRDLKVGPLITKDQAKKIVWKVLGFLPLVFMGIAGIKMSHIRYVETGKLTALGWLILSLVIGGVLTGLVWWQI